MSCHIKTIMIATCGACVFGKPSLSFLQFWRVWKTSLQRNRSSWFFMATLLRSSCHNFAANLNHKIYSLLTDTNHVLRSFYESLGVFCLLLKHEACLICWLSDKSLSDFSSLQCVYLTPTGRSCPLLVYSLARTNKGATEVGILNDKLTLN